MLTETKSRGAFLKTGNNVKKVLVVDDEKDITMLLSARLSALGHKTVEAHTLEMAVEKAKNLDPDVVFLDLKLPDGIGFSIIDKLREINSAIKIVIVSAHDGKEERDEAENKEVDFFIDKPLTKSKFQAAVREVRLAGNIASNE